MALNFPPNPADKSIYIDPSSGLKYIFNGSVGAWETALQPPVITSTNEKPLLKLEGFLWWDHQERMMYVFKGGNWVPIMAPGGSGGLGVPVVCAPEPPENAKEGWLWWHSVEGNLYVYYEDEPDPVTGVLSGTGQWVNVMATSGGTGSVNANSINSEVPPPYPNDGQLWFNTSNQTLYVWDAPAGVWYPAAHGANISSNIEAIDPLYISKADNFHTINIYRATSFQEGVSRFADVTNSADKTKNNLYVSPAYLNTEVAELESKIADLQAQIDILKSYHP